MPAANFRGIGITEVGDVPVATDVPWGNTTQDGVTLQLSTETVDLQSAQATMLENTSLLSTVMSLVINLVVSEATVLQQLWGLPAGALTGDLPTTDEVLTITESNLGSEVLTLYVLGPGPTTTRRLDIEEAKVSDIGDIQFGSNGYMLPNATWSILNPTVGDPLVLTDAM